MLINKADWWVRVRNLIHGLHQVECACARGWSPRRMAQVLKLSALTLLLAGPWKADHSHSAP